MGFKKFNLGFITDPALILLAVSAIIIPAAFKNSPTLLSYLSQDTTPLSSIAQVIGEGEYIQEGQPCYINSSSACIPGTFCMPWGSDKITGEKTGLCVKSVKNGEPCLAVLGDYSNERRDESCESRWCGGAKNTESEYATFICVKKGSLETGERCVDRDESCESNHCDGIDSWKHLICSGEIITPTLKPIDSCPACTTSQTCVRTEENTLSCANKGTGTENTLCEDKDGNQNNDVCSSGYSCKIKSDRYYCTKNIAPPTPTGRDNVTETLPGSGFEGKEVICENNRGAKTNPDGTRVYQTGPNSKSGPRCGTPPTNFLAFDATKAVPGTANPYCGKQYADAWECNDGTTEYTWYPLASDASKVCNDPQSWCPKANTNPPGNPADPKHTQVPENPQQPGDVKKGIGEACDASGTICDPKNNSTACYAAIDGTSLHCCRFTERYCAKTGECVAGGTQAFQDCGKPTREPTITPDGYFNAQACSGAPGSPTNHCGAKDAADKIIPCCPGYREQRSTTYCACVPNTTSSTQSQQTIASASECSRNSDCKKVHKNVCVLNSQNIGTCE